MINKPQTTITQRFSVANAVANVDLNTVVVGQQYALSRYEKEDVQLFDYDTAGLSLPFRVPDGYGDYSTVPFADVDLTSISVNAVNVPVNLGEFSPTNIRVLNTSRTNVLELLNGCAHRIPDTSGGLSPEFNGRSLQVGDSVLVTDNDGYSRVRSVVGFEGIALASSFGGNSPAFNNESVIGDFNNPKDGAVGAFTVLEKPAASSIALAAATPLSGIVLTHVNGTTRFDNFGYGVDLTLEVTTAGAPGTAVVRVTDSASDSHAWTVTTGVIASTSNFAVDIQEYYDADVDISLVIDNDDAPLIVGQIFRVRLQLPYASLDVEPAIITTGTYTGKHTATYLVEVVTGTRTATATGAVLRITDTTGVEPPYNAPLTEDTPVSLGSYGLQLKVKLTGIAVPQKGLRAGDRYLLTAVPASTDPQYLSRIILDGPAMNPSTPITELSSVLFHHDFSGLLTSANHASGVAWTVDEEDQSVAVKSDLSVKLYADDGSAFQAPMDSDYKGHLALSFRYRVYGGATEGLRTLTSSAAIIAQLGPIDPENPLAYAAYRNFLAANSELTYALRYSEPGATGLSKALKKIENNRDTYALVVLASNDVERGIAAAHVNAVSAPNRKRFRKVYMGINSPGEVTALTETPIGTPVTGSVSTFNGKRVLLSLTDTESIDLRLLELRTDDIVFIPSNGKRYKIASVLSAWEIILADEADVAAGIPFAFQIIRADTPENQVHYLTQIARSFVNHRVTLVWTEGGTSHAVDDGLTEVDNAFVAAEVGGLRVSLPPQRGLTRAEITTVTSTPNIYIRYTEAQLDELANAGILIVGQEAENAPVTIRHQLTTRTNDGPLYYEDNLGVIADVVGFRLDNLINPTYIGKRNVTPETLRDIRNDVFAELHSCTQVEDTAVARDLGPLLLAFRGLSVTVHPTLHSNVRVRYIQTIPQPLNNVDVLMDSETAAVVVDFGDSPDGAATEGLVIS